MKLVLSQYLRTLRERDEFDRLMPELLFEMGYVTLSTPHCRGPVCGLANQTKMEWTKFSSLY